jgi:short-subunit dehydrogenase
VVIFGATSAIAEHCARIWVRQSVIELLLVGRDSSKLELVAADLRVRSPSSSIRCLQADFVDLEHIGALVQTIAGLGAIDIALIAHGSLPDQKECERDLGRVAEALSVNGLSPVLIAEALAQPMQAAGRGTIAIIGSVAGERGRKSNYVYGAAKGMVARYAQGLQHRLAGSGVKIVLIKPGPTDTPMTAHLKAAGSRLASVDSVAQAIVKGIDLGRPEIYVPARWLLIMLVIRHLPRWIFNRMDI